MLVIRFDPESDESLSGFVLRLAAANKYDRPSDMFAGPFQTSATPDMQFISAEVAEAVAPLVELEPGCLVGKAYTGPSCATGLMSFYGVQLPPSHLSIRHPKVCPHCLLARPITPRQWDLALWVVCPIHRRYLIDRCTFCKEPIRWNRPSVTECHHCDSLLTSASAQPAGQAAIALSLALASKIPSETGARCPSKLAEKLEKLDLRTLLDLVKFLGSPPRARRPSRRKVTSDQASSVFKSAAKILDRWPEGFHRLIRQWEHPDQTLTLFRAILTHDFPDVSLQFLEDEYRSYVSQNRSERSLSGVSTNETLYGS
jgi:TniQ